MLESGAEKMDGDKTMNIKYMKTGVGMKNYFWLGMLAAILLFCFSGCGAGECTVCGSEEDTKSFLYLSENEKGALCAVCRENALGDPELCAWCQREPAEGFYVNGFNIPVFVCQECYDGL